MVMVNALDGADGSQTVHPVREQPPPASVPVRVDPASKGGQYASRRFDEWNRPPRRHDSEDDTSLPPFYLGSRALTRPTRLRHMAAPEEHLFGLFIVPPEMISDRLRHGHPHESATITEVDPDVD